ncbi:MAG: class I SAM-dependent methyltransferase [Bacteroidales bacterium]|jgi:2-polyprenyl-3-methyl-5-hydroxy-6-metoxy-1,4-benzoquinol methylase|nr:class I SAM-dependent methyltransferase [Bacteroidales bacterium]HOI32664.1 class I SAM-dependent methyltransferase [Bacteroidales bacterium]
MQSYQHKPEAYFTNARKDILPLLPGKATTALEIGCGNGATLRMLQQSGRIEKAIGIELHEIMAKEAARHLDEVLTGEAAKQITRVDNGQIDLMLCLDVLEHMADPWAFLAQAAPKLKKGGLLIASIPNMRTAVVISKLLFQGKFDYHNGGGIMDRTHLRYFTRRSALALMNQKPFEVERIMPSPNAAGSKSQLANIFTLGLMRAFFTEQYLIRSVKVE